VIQIYSLNFTKILSYPTEVILCKFLVTKNVISNVLFVKYTPIFRRIRKIAKTTIKCVMTDLPPSVRPYGTTRATLDGYHEI